MNSSVIAVIVTYEFDLIQLRQLIDSINRQVQGIIIVDNGSTHADSLEQYASSHLHIELLGVNQGIAAAHNIGVGLAKQLKATHVILFDQDSLPSADMVKELLIAIRDLPDAACVGPYYIDNIKGATPSLPCLEGSKYIPVDYLISSGCLIPISLFDKIGGMREDFFIDQVDIEWGLRAKHFNYQSYFVCSAHMQHNLGERAIKLFGKLTTGHKPFRYYYQFRNELLLCRLPWLTVYQKIIILRRMVLRYIFFSLFVRPRIKHVRMMTLGLWHGIIGKTGKLE